MAEGMIGPLPHENQDFNTPARGTTEAQPDISYGIKTKSVDNIKRGAVDDQDRMIERVFFKKPGEYAIYKAGSIDKVCVFYADDQRLEESQRRRISTIGKERAEIIALLADWPKSDVYEWKLAVALRLLLEEKDGSETIPITTNAARSLIKDAQTDLIKERAAKGRIHYVTFTSAIPSFWKNAAFSTA